MQIYYYIIYYEYDSNLNYITWENYYFEYDLNNKII